MWIYKSFSCSDLIYILNSEKPHLSFKLSISVKLCSAILALQKMLDAKIKLSWIAI